MDFAARFEALEKHRENCAEGRRGNECSAVLEVWYENVLRSRGLGKTFMLA